MSYNLTFKPKLITKKLLAHLPKREQAVLTGRFGLGATVKRETLESIGTKYAITRERVRQIENRAIVLIQESKAYTDLAPVFSELSGIISDLGGVVSEQELLDAVTQNEGVQNHIHFLLVVSELFTHMKEDHEFVHRWSNDHSIAESIQNGLRNVYRTLAPNELITEKDILDRFSGEIKHIKGSSTHPSIKLRWLGLSKKMSKNPLGEWGRGDAPGVKVKNMRDMAYLTLKRHGSPMHFAEVAKTISDIFGKKAHEATCHNELIKDSRFVLVGRGLYALTEWGYSKGVVKDVIKAILKKEGPLTKNEIIERVKRERYVKDGTIVVNLQDTHIFKRNEAMQYSLK
jgi:hypothetical protein